MKRALFLLLLVSVSAAAQTNLSVPSVVPQQCSGDDCSKAPPESSGRAETNTSAVQQEVTGGALQNKPIQLQLRYPPPGAQQTTEFQKFVYKSTGQQLPIYGHSLFDNVPSTFAPVDGVPVPADYVVGPGDQLLIRAWGQIDLDARVLVDREGQIYLPKVGTINVAGLKYEQLNDYLRNTIGQLFKNFNLNVNLGQLRSIQIFVVGQARRPGTYTVSSLSTLVNALFASGGPALDGSMRHIQLKRQNQVVTEFDLYDLLLNGDKSKDALLQPGDVIYIPPVGHLVAIAGSVNLPAIYEVRGGTRIEDAIAIAGGLSTTAETSRAVLERIENRSTRRVEEFTLDSGGMARPLQDGDVLRIFSVSPKFENAVTLRGNVAQPGRYPWKNGMRICDLIPSRDMLITRAYWAQQNSLGRTAPSWINTNEPNLPTGINRISGETDTDPSRSNAGEPYVSTGINRIPGETNTDPGWISANEPNGPTEINRIPTEINWDYAVVQRLNPSDLSSRLLPFNLGHAIDDPASGDDLILEPGDVITIFSQNDLTVPLEKRTKFVSIEGEVKAAGIYRVNPGETLRDLVRRAGGLTPKAYLYAAQFLRESTRLEQQKQLDKLVEDMDRSLRSKATVVTASSTPDNMLQAQQEMAAQERMLDGLRRVRATGRIVLELKPGDNDISAFPPLALEDGDRLIIPPKPATVEVVGAVYNQNSFIYKPGRTVGSYLSQAGGGTRDADTRRLFVIRADGSVVSKQMHRGTWFDSFESLKLMPGDSIVMPEKIRTGDALRGFRDWSQLFSNFALGAASVSVIR